MFIFSVAVRQAEIQVLPNWAQVSAWCRSKCSFLLWGLALGQFRCPRLGEGWWRQSLRTCAVMGVFCPNFVMGMVDCPANAVPLAHSMCASLGAGVVGPCLVLGFAMMAWYHVLSLIPILYFLLFSPSKKHLPALEVLGVEGSVTWATLTFLSS